MLYGFIIKISELNVNMFIQVIGHPVYIESSRIAIYLHMDDEIQTNQLLHHMFNNRKQCFIPW